MSESNIVSTIPSLELASNLGIGANIIKNINLGADENAIRVNNVVSNLTLLTISWLITSLALLIANSLNTLYCHLAFPFNYITRATKGTLLGVSEFGITVWGQNISRATSISSIKPFKDIQNVKICKKFLDIDDIDKP